ncbi:MAG: hypothetical protein IKM94_03435 [Alphaproteobacteria bacterium]|nr:hypothetical protein [Alphaproteobacteria bacterium]
MKKIPQKTRNRITALQQEYDILQQQYEKYCDTALKKYNLEEEPDPTKQNDWTDDEWEYACDTEQHYSQKERQQCIIEAKAATYFLIATNIARRGKPLHPDTAKRKLQKYGDDGKNVARIIERAVVPQVLNAEPYIHRELYKYGITLMDTTMYHFCIAQINRYKQYGKYGEKHLQHYINFSKRFHKSIVQRLNQNLYEPF